MSHFSVLVIGEDHEGQLAPYQENNMGDCPSEYMEFQEEDYREEYEKGDAETKEKYPTYDIYMEEYQGCKKSEAGVYGYWTNPNCKWDWYSVGGRWSGYFKINDKAEGLLGESGVMGSHKNRGPGWVDQALVKDIDFDFMKKDEAEKASKKYRIAEEVFGGSIPKIEISWEVMLKREGLTIDEKRTLYHAQPGMKRKQELSKEHWDNKEHPAHDFLVWGELSDYQCTHDEFVQHKRNQAVPTFAVLMNGNWYERGEMGWWGCVSDEKDQGDWNEEFNKLLKTVPGDTLLTLVDCHI